MSQNPIPGGESSRNTFGAFRQQEAVRNAAKRAAAPPEPVIMTIDEAKVPSNLQGKEKDAARFYPAFAPLDKDQRFPLAIIHSGEQMYRQKDVPSFKPKKGKDWTSKFHAMLVIDQDVETAFGHPSMSWDPSLFNKLDPRDLSVTIKPSTQSPVFEVSIVMTRKAEGDKMVPNKTIQCHIFANSILRDTSNIGIDFDMGTQAVKHASAGSYPDTPTMKKLESDGTLCRLHLDLIDPAGKPADTGAGGRVVWTRTDILTVESYCARLNQPSNTLTAAETLVARLHMATEATFYFDVRKDTIDDPSFARFEQFVRTVFYLAATIGNYWYYRMASPNTNTTDAEFPYSQIPPPRWLCKLWRNVYQDGVAISSDVLEWGQLGEVTSFRYPDKFTYPFMSKLGMSREQTKAKRATDAILSSDQVAIYGHFYGDPLGSNYIVELSVGGLRLDGKGLVMPDIGRTAWCDVNYSGNIYRLNAVTIDDVQCSGSAFTLAAVPAKPGLPRIPTGEKLAVTLSFPVDETAISRTMNAVAIMEAGQKRKEGIYFPETMLGAPAPATLVTPAHTSVILTSQSGYLAKHFADNPNELAIYNEELAKHGLNVQQSHAAKLVSGGSKHELFVWGPPGTGKTLVGIAIARALYMCGLSVLITAPGNAAVDRAMEVWNKTPLSGKSLVSNHDSRIIRFTGGLVNTRPKWKQEQTNKGEESETDVLMADVEGTADAADESAANDSADVSVVNTQFSGLWSDEMEDKNDDRLAAIMEMVALGVNKSKGHSEYSLAARKFAYIQRVANKTPRINDKDFKLLTKTGLGPGATAQSKKKADDMLKNAQKFQAEAKEYLDILSKLENPAIVSKRKEMSARFRDLDGYFGAEYLKREVRVVFVTNNSAGHHLLTDNFQPKVHIADECGQSGPGDGMVPAAAFKEHIRFQVNLADHKQLKPVVISSNCNECLSTMQISPFQKKFEAYQSGEIDIDFVMLKRQYRMHPDLVDYSNKKMYDGQLTTDYTAAQETEFDRKVLQILEPLQGALWNGSRRIAIDVSNNSLPENVRMGDIVQQEKYNQTPSSANPNEASLVVDLVVGLLGAGIDASDINVLTPYQGQKLLILNGLWGQTTVDARGVLVKSTDASQGTEAKIVIMSLVANDPKDQENLGFIYDENRINVGITRSQRFFFVFGNFRGWYRVILGCKQVQGGGFLTSKKVKFFSDFVIDCHDKRHIIAAGNWITALEHGKKVSVSTFYEGLIPIAPKKRYNGVPDQDLGTFGGLPTSLATRVEALLPDLAPPPKARKTNK